ncbi:hypothetical protein HN51_053950 [Arachis hypogaea]
MKLLIPSLACSLCVALHPSFNSSRFWDLLPDQPLPTAISLFQQLQSRVIAPNLFTLNILINCSCGMVWITLVVSTFAKIFKSDFQPYIVTLTTIIKGLCLCDAKKMEKKREIVEYRERLDNTLASPHMTNYHMLKNLVQTQLLHSSKQQEFYQGEGVESLR